MTPDPVSPDLKSVLKRLRLGRIIDTLPERLVLGWTGMRGVVSLAGALALPTRLADGSAFPQRDLIQFLTFWVIFATLVLQGLTLPLLIRLLGVNRQAEPPGEPPSC